jgi:hypothetical protein
MGIAAGFAGLLFLSALFFNSNTTLSTAPTPLSDTEKFKDEITPLEVTEEGVPLEERIVDTQNERKEMALPAPVFDAGEALKPSNKEITGASDQDSEEPTETDALWQGSEEVISAKIAALVAQVAVMEEERSAVTDSEIDSMLRQAQREILMEKQISENRSVDATALLLDVEDELEQSFRDQIFETLKSGYLKVRTAVADRNK